MRIEKTEFEDLYIIHPTLHGDDRGYFMETYSQKILGDRGINIDFVQDNEALSKKGALRGLHYQLPPFAQTKLVRVIEGEVLDIVVDIRPDSETYGKYFSIKLNAINKIQLLVPHGFAHGYVTLSDKALFLYKVDNIYSRDHEAGISYNDPDLKIDWGEFTGNYIVSAKDQNQPSFKDHIKFQ